MATQAATPEPSRAAEIARMELTHLPPATPLIEVFSRACALSAEVLSVERVGVWLFIDGGSALRCANLYERSKQEHSSGAILRVDDFPAYFASLKIRKAIPAEVAATDPSTVELSRQYLEPLGITSMLDAGIFVESELVGVVCHENVGKVREWTTEARDFAGSVADLLALRIQSAEVRDLRDHFLTQEDRLAAQDRAAALEQLAAGVAHDFRNLLTVFLAQGELLRMRSDLPPDAREEADLIVATAERGIAIAAELMEFARPAPRQPAVLDLAAAIPELLPMLQAAVGARHEVRYARPTGLGQVLIDKSQFTRLLLNLVVNARDAQPNGGSIDLRLSPVRLKDDAAAVGTYLLLEVSDRGCGMDEHTMRRALDPYFTTKANGTGLGLAVVRQAVSRAGGLLRIQSDKEKGTTVRVFFPRIGASTGSTAIFILPPEMREAGTR